MSDHDKTKASLTSKVFEDEGEFIYIRRKYASYEKPNQDDKNTKLIKYVKGTYAGYLPTNAHENLEEYSKRYFYEPIQKKNKGIAHFDKRYKADYLITDEIRVPITAENIDTYLKVSKTVLENLSSKDIASWFSYKETKNLNANTAEKKNTAIKMRITEILKLLPRNKNIEPYLDVEDLKKGKDELNLRNKKRQDAEKKEQERFKVSLITRLRFEFNGFLPHFIFILIAIYLGWFFEFGPGTEWFEPMSCEEWAKERASGDKLKHMEVLLECYENAE
tara:strand:- start:106 stop:936 length:831 start_codon:yes stop_codon:yes gene_type:complete